MRTALSCVIACDHAVFARTPLIWEFDDDTRRNPSETSLGSWAISFACRFYWPCSHRCRTWDCLHGVAARHPVGARRFHCLVARYGMDYALSVPRGSGWRRAKKRALALGLEPRRELLFSYRHIVFGIHSALTAVEKCRDRWPTPWLIALPLARGLNPVHAPLGIDVRCPGSRLRPE